MQSLYAFLADVVLVIHLAYVGIVVFGLLAIMAGIALRWNWTRNPWFRFTHLGMILIVAIQALVGVLCPLTTLENHLRLQAGQNVEAGTFVGRLLQKVMFPDWPPEVFTPVYVGFALLVMATFIVAPPRLRRKSPSEPQHNTPAVAH